MKKFVNAELVELNVNETAYGPTESDVIDEVKYAVTDDFGNILGWEQTYGTDGGSNKN